MSQLIKQIFLSSLLIFCSSISVAQTNSKINVGDFDKPLTKTWKSKKKQLERIYKLKTEDNNSYLAAQSLNEDNFLIKKIKVDLVKFPYLNWKWRAHTLPLNGDESVKQYCDVAACLNVVLKASRWRPRTIKYSWSTTLEKGTRTKSPFAYWPSRCDIVVIQSGDADLGVWHTEKVNVLDDYLQFYELNQVKELIIEAFVIMTDSDNTNSPSAADYDDIYFSEK